MDNFTRIKKTALCLISICLLLWLTLACLRVSVSAEDSIFTRSAWTAIKVCTDGSGDYKDVVSNDYAVALFIDEATATFISWESQFSFTYAKTTDGFVSDNDLNTQIKAFIDGDTMMLHMQGSIWLMKKTEINKALDYARSLVGPDYTALPFENDEIDESLVGSDAAILADDEICTIRSAGLFTVPVYIVPEPEETAAYLLSITNNSDQTIKIDGGYLSDDTSEFSYGSINGKKALAMVYADAHSSSPYFFDTGIQPIAPGEKAEFYLCAIADLTHYPSESEMTDVTINLYATNYTGDFWYRNYILPMDEQAAD